MPLTTIPSDFGQGGANLSEGEPKLGPILEEHREAIETAGADVSAVASDVEQLTRHAELTGSAAGDLTFDIDDSTRFPGTLFAANETLGLFVAVPTDRYPGGSVFTSPSPMEILGQAGDKVWIRVDKLSHPLKTQPILYVGNGGTPLSPSGISAVDAFIGFDYMADMFGNSMEWINPFMTIVLTENAPTPMLLSGDFGGGVAAEAGASIGPGDVVQIQPDGTVVPCLADTDANAALAIGMSSNVAVLPDEDNPRKAVIVAFGPGFRRFQAESGVTFAGADKIYISGSEPGKVTNVAPAHARQIGICTSNEFGLLFGLAKF